MAKVLVACEFSGVVREAFRRRGHAAYSVDLLPASDGSPYHFQDDIYEYLHDGWDLMIAHPPCTYLSVSGLHWNNKVPGRAEKTEAALKFVKDLMNAPIKRICIENPVSCISSRVRKPDQIIQPYEFGHDASKKTCLWLKNLPLLVKDTGLRIRGRLVDGKERFSNQTDSGQNKLAPSENRWKERSVTYQGIADAMAEQWSPLCRRS